MTSQLCLALCASLALFSIVAAKAVAEAEARPEPRAEARPEARPGAEAGLGELGDYRFVSGLGANALVNPFSDLRRGLSGLNGYRSGLTAVKSVVPLDSTFGLKGYTPLYSPTELNAYGTVTPGYGTVTAAALAAQAAQAARLRGISAARAALINQAFANHYYDNLYRAW